MNQITVFLLAFLIISCGDHSGERLQAEKAESENLEENQLPPHEVNSTEVITTNEVWSIWDTVDAKVYEFTENKKINRDLNKIPKDFLNFYTKFITDSSYQMQHIDFNDLIGVYGECDTTIHINKSNWEISDWNFLDYFDKDNNTKSIGGWDNRFYFDDKQFYYQFDAKEIGTIYQVGFEKKRDQWKMTLYFVNNC